MCVLPAGFKTAAIWLDKEKIDITFKKPSFFFGRKFLSEINLSALVNNLIFKLRFNVFQT